jgi:serine/threonine-protein kinase
MREQGGRILLMDFGLSSLEQLQTNIAGTPSYMAPELFQGGQSTVATDIYAMGVMLYYLVAEDYPVRLAGLTPTEALAALAKRRPLMDLRSDLPESLLRTVSTATEMDPAKRFASAGQLASALAESLGTKPFADSWWRPS